MTTLSGIARLRLRLVGIELELTALEHRQQPVDDFLTAIARPGWHAGAPILLAGNMNVVFATSDVIERQLERLNDAVLQFLVHPICANTAAGVITAPHQLALA